MLGQVSLGYDLLGQLRQGSIMLGHVRPV